VARAAIEVSNMNRSSAGCPLLHVMRLGPDQHKHRRAEIHRYFPAADPAFFDGRSLGLLADR
jgi:hypothetical protein